MPNSDSFIVTKAMADRSFVQICNAGSPDTIVAFFKQPNDCELLKKWSQAIPREESNLKISSRVCSRHFEEDEVLKGRTG